MIQKIFIDALPEIQKVYEDGLVCSERHFQAEIYNLIKPALNTNNYNVFIEPIISSNSVNNEYELNGIIPDMIATQGNSIKAIIELKYVPHGFVSFEKDIKNMSKFYAAKNNNYEYYLLTDKNTGEWNKNKSFQLDPELILIYVLISNSDAYCVTNPQEIWKPNYTNLNEVPKFYQLTGSINPTKNSIQFSVTNYYDEPVKKKL